MPSEKRKAPVSAAAEQRLQWPTIASIEQAAALKGELLTALEAAAPLTVDLAAVRSLDLAGVQLLCAARRTAGLRSRSLHLAGRDNPVVAAAMVDNGFDGQQVCHPECGDRCLWHHPAASN